MRKSISRKLCHSPHSWPIHRSLCQHIPFTPVALLVVGPGIVDRLYLSPLGYSFKGTTC